MKKALITAALAGFIGTFLKNDIKILQSMGFEVHCAANRGNKSEEANKQFFQNLGTQFHQIDISSKAPWSKENIIAYKQIRNLIKEERFELIHCHTPIAGALTRLAAAPVKFGGGAKVIYTSHGFYFHSGSSIRTWMVYYTIEKAMSILSNAIITINEEDFKNAKKMFSPKIYHINGVGFESSKFVDIHINRKEYRKELGISPNDLMLLAVGELSDRKNHQVIIKALGKVQLPNAIFVICGKAISGQGTYDKLEKLANHEGVRVIFLGHRADIPEICKCADIGVLPSTREGLGMAGLEMLASGLPLVTSNVHGIKDYMSDGVNGFMCNPFDVDAFADAIIKLSDYSLRMAMRNSCVSSVGKFDRVVSNAQMVSIYQELWDV